MGNSTPPSGGFDVKLSYASITKAMAGIVKLTFRRPGEPPDMQTADMTFTAVTEALGAGISACNEVKRLNGEVSAVRDSHRPRPHADPRAPGALCDACSVHGVLVNWPCGVWRATDSILSGTGA